MEKKIKVTPEDLACQLDIDPIQLNELMIAIGFAQIGNEAYRKAILDGRKIPTEEHYKETIQSYIDEVNSMEIY